MNLHYRQWGLKFLHHPHHSISESESAIGVSQRESWRPPHLVSMLYLAIWSPVLLVGSKHCLEIKLIFLIYFDRDIKNTCLTHKSNSAEVPESRNQPKERWSKLKSEEEEKAPIKIKYPLQARFVKTNTRLSLGGKQIKSAFWNLALSVSVKDTRIQAFFEPTLRNRWFVSFFAF